MDLLRGELPRAAGYYLCLLLVSTLLGWLSVGRTLILREFDLPILLLGGFAAFGCHSLLQGGKLPLRQRVAGAFAWFSLRSIGLALALLCFFRQQGGGPNPGLLPWQWPAFTSLFNLAAAGIYAATVWPILAKTAPRRPVRYADWLELWWAAGMLDLLFLGGRGLPWGVHPALSVLAFVCKLLGVGLLLLFWRFVGGYVTVAECRGVRRVLLAPSLLLAAWHVADQSGRLPAIGSLPSWVVFTGVLSLFGSVALRAAWHRGAAAWDSSVNPWI